MHVFKIELTDVAADTAEEAALLAFQAMTSGNAPIEFRVTDENGVTISIALDRTRAAEFSKEDHTADPGNW